jgi:hypothetical protein
VNNNHNTYCLLPLNAGANRLALDCVDRSSAAAVLYAAHRTLRTNACSHSKQSNKVQLSADVHASPTERVQALKAPGVLCQHSDCAHTCRHVHTQLELEKSMASGGTLLPTSSHKSHVQLLIVCQLAPLTSLPGKACASSRASFVASFTMLPCLPGSAATTASSCSLSGVASYSSSSSLRQRAYMEIIREHKRMSECGVHNKTLCAACFLRCPKQLKQLARDA